MRNYSREIKKQRLASIIKSLEQAKNDLIDLDHHSSEHDYRDYANKIDNLLNADSGDSGLIATKSKI